MKTVAELISLPNPLLRKPSKRITKIDDSVLGLVKLLENTGLNWEDTRSFEVCVGLASIQIGELKRLVILRDGKNEDRKFRVLINPRLIRTYGEPDVDFEGCLSVPDIYGLVPRYPKIRYQAMGLDGKTQRYTAEGFEARLIQHEIDHTSGKVFIDHIKGVPEAFYKIDAEGQITREDYDKILASGIFR